MSVLTIRLPETEKAALSLRAKAEGTTAGGLVRRLIRNKPFVLAADVLAEMESLMGDKRLSVKARR